MHISPPRLTVTKNLKSKKSNMADGGHLENRKIVISPKPFGRFCLNFVLEHILVSRAYQLFKKLNF